MAEFESFKHLMQGPLGDRAVLLLTFALTVMLDLTVAIEVGLILAAFLFMHRMSEVVAIGSYVALLDEDVDDLIQVKQPKPNQRAQLPEGVEVYQLSGPLFFAVAKRLRRCAQPVSEAAAGIYPSHASGAPNRCQRCERVAAAVSALRAQRYARHSVWTA